MYCKNCGTDNAAGARFCRGCGADLTAANQYSAGAAYSQNYSQPVQAQPTVVYVNENNHIPYEYTPISAWGYFGYQLLFSIPLVGFICLIIFSFSSNINLRNFARSYWCIFVLALVLLLVFGAAMTALIAELALYLR